MRAVNVVIVVIVLCAAVAFADQIAPKVLINNQPIAGEVIEHKGRVYIAVDDLAVALGAKTVITAEAGKARIIALMLPVTMPAEASGSVEGIVTYYFEPFAKVSQNRLKYQTLAWVHTCEDRHRVKTT